MTGELQRRRRYVVAILIASGLYLAANDNLLARAATPVPSAEATGSYGFCNEDCGPSVECETQCWSYCDQCPLYLTTCGDYSGEPWNGYGMCIGTCSDGYCNEYNNEDPDTCYEDCGECGDYVCEGPEDVGWCPVDCHVCGDSICTAGYENCSTCTQDCNPTYGQCGQGDPVGDECDEGKIWNGAGYCCDIELLVEGLDECSLCSENEQCVFILAGSGGWGCVGVGETCGNQEAGSAPRSPN